MNVAENLEPGRTLPVRRDLMVWYELWAEMERLELRRRELESGGRMVIVGIEP